MTESATLQAVEPVDRAAADAALAAHFRNLLLEHARLGRSIHESRNGQVVEVTPAEIFARYGLDEFGRPVPAAGG